MMDMLRRRPGIRLFISVCGVLLLLCMLLTGCSQKQSGGETAAPPEILWPRAFREESGSAEIVLALDDSEVPGVPVGSEVVAVLTEDGADAALVSVTQALEGKTSGGEITVSVPLDGLSGGSYRIRLELQTGGSTKEVMDSTELYIKDHLIQLTARSAACLIPYMTDEEKVMLVTGSADIAVPGAAGATAAIERFGIPSVVMADGPAGVRLAAATISYPSDTNIANTWNPGSASAVGEAIGRNAAACGVDLMLGPGINIQRDVLCGRNFEYYSEDPLLTGYMAAAYVKGMQRQQVGATIKHFAANNQESSRGSVSSEVTERALREIYLTAFEIIVKDAHPWAVMSSYNRVNGIHTGVNRDLLTGILREEWGFDGLVMTDWGAAGSKHELLEAGNDLSMPGAAADVKTLLRALERGRLTKEALDECCENILRVIGRTLDKDAGRAELEEEASRKVSRDVAAESIVLLKNEQALPVKGEIALFGNAQLHTVTTGFGSGNVGMSHTVSIREGIQECSELSLNEMILNLYGDCPEGQESNPQEDPYEITVSAGDAELAASQAKAAVIVIARTTTEGEDHRAGDGDFCLNEKERQLIQVVSEAFHAADKKVIVILNSGNPMEVASWRGQADAILYAGIGGQEMGHAVADVLCGNVNPSGKLSATFPISYDSVPEYGYFPGSSELSYYYEDIYVGYRYYQTFGVDVAYPFGFGLSYTTFEYSDMKLSADTLNDGSDTVTVTLKVRNSGKTAGREVVQIYVVKPDPGIGQPALTLAGFAKTGTIQPGKSETVTVTVSAYGLRYYDTEGSAWRIAAGAYTVYAAASVTDLRLNADFTVGDTLLVQDVENRCEAQWEFPVLTQKDGMPSRDRGENLALGKRAYADATEGNLVASNAVDGDFTSRWSGLGGTSLSYHYLEVDLGDVYTLSSIIIRWEAIGSNYRVEIRTSKDEDWQEVARRTGNKPAIDDIDLSGVQARYVRVRTGTSGFVSIYELEVYGS